MSGNLVELFDCPVQSLGEQEIWIDQCPNVLNKPLFAVTREPIDPAPPTEAHRSVSDIWVKYYSPGVLAGPSHFLITETKKTRLQQNQTRAIPANVGRDLRDFAGSRLFLWYWMFRDGGGFRALSLACQVEHNEMRKCQMPRAVQWHGQPFRATGSLKRKPH